MKRNLVSMLVAAAVLAGTAGLAVAAGTAGHGEDDPAIGQAKVSLTQAVAAAEQKVGGKVAHASFENENGRPVFGVEVVNGGQATDVKVDAMTGQVLSAQADRPDAAREGRGEADD